MKGRKDRTTLAILVCVIALLGLPGSPVSGEGGPKISEPSRECLECHESVTPGIVADWKLSRHARTTPGLAMKKPELQRRVSAKKVPEGLSGTAVGCAECHTANPGAHKDTFEHVDHKVHPVVTPKDCAVCHPVEQEQFSKNIMCSARTNLTDNKLYQSLITSINGVQSFNKMKLATGEPAPATNEDSCLVCHGTKIGVTGKRIKDTDFGEMEFPILTGWPNQGVGRSNPDGSDGSCAACHTRHRFSIATARKPYTCSQCHKGPDVPAYKVYMVSKHGNLFSGSKGEWSFDKVPWTVGKDFTAPTCATCHMSLIVSPAGDVIAKRTHQAGDRLAWRILGLPYAHAHPRSPDTSIIRNKAGQPLPVTLTGEPAKAFLIDPKEQAKRRGIMQGVCLSCHTSDWVEGHWARFESTINETNQRTLAATKILLAAWDKKAADPGNMFDETIEKQWVELWLFHGNSTMLASAMMGADYGVFAGGRWQMSGRIREMHDRLKLFMENKPKKP